MQSAGQATTAGAFGSTPFRQTTSSSPFGSSTSAFGASTTPAFGAQTSAPAFGTAPLFGGQTSSIGSTQQPTANMFGNTSTSAFGSATPAFGSAAGSTPLFGSTATTSAFGTSPSNAFGSSSTPAFGSTATTTSAFGGSGAPSFGSNAFGGGTSAFGTSTFGGTTTTPATAAPAFGGAAAPTFGSPAPTSTFGAPATSSFGLSAGGASSFGGSMFGSTAASAQPQQTTSSFGGFGTTTSSFGQTQPATSNFGGSIFGGTSSFAPQQQQQQQGQGALATVPSISTVGNGFDVLDKKFEYLHRRKEDLQKSIYSSGPTGMISSSDNKHSANDKSTALGNSNNTRSVSTGSSPAFFSNGNGYRHTPLQAIYRSPGLRALSGPQSLQGSFMNRSKSNQQLSETGFQYMTPTGNRTLASSGRFSSFESASSSRGSTLLFSSSTNSLAVSASKHPKRLVIESAPSSNVEISVDDICRRAIHQVSGVGTPNALRDDKTGQRSADRSAAVVSDDDDEIHDRSPKLDEKYCTPSTKVLSIYNFREQALAGDNAPAVPPTLSKDSGYVTSPDISVLREMDSNELRHVYHFTILHPKFGKIVWDDDCDLTGLDLDDIISMEQNSVSVYEGSVEKPEVGEGLNKPAVITLYNVRPIGDGGVEQFISAVLKPACLKDDADFISYDEQSFEWTFRVFHFSRYGLASADDNGQNEVAGRAQEAVVKENLSVVGNNAAPSGFSEPKIVQHFLIPPQGADMEIVSPDPTTRVNSFSVAGVNLSASLSLDTNGLRRMRYPLTETQSSKMDLAADNETNSCFLSEPKFLFVKDPAVIPEFRQESVRNGKNSLSNVLLNLSKEFVSSTTSDGDSFCAAALKAAKQELSPANNSTHSNTARAEGRPDAALLHRKSFRAGFDSWGRLAFASTDSTMHNSSSGNNLMISIMHLNVGYIGVQAVTDASSLSAFDEYASRTRSERNVKCFASCLESILRASRLVEQKISDDDCVKYSPYWALPNADRFAGLNEDYVKFVELLNNMSENYNLYFKEALSRGCSYSDERTLAVETMGHDQEWIILKCVDFLNALFGQELSWLIRFKSGEENLHLPSMLPNDGEHESIIRAAEDKRQLFFTEERGNRGEILFTRTHIERRRAALSKWLQDVCINFGEGLCGLVTSSSDESPAQRIFELLSAHRIVDAVDAAEDAGMYRLATLLSQLGGDPDFAFLMRQQLESWFQTGAYEFIDSDILDIYKLLGSDMSSSGGNSDSDDLISSSHQSSVLSRVSWVRAIGLLFWYSCSCVDAAPLDSTDSMAEPFFLTTLTTLQNAVDEYLRAVECGVALEPRSPAAEIASMTSSSHAIFSLMLHCSGMTTCDGLDIHVERLVADSTGFTRDPMDHRGSYLVLSLLRCVTGNDVAQESDHFAIIRQHIISELLFSGQWHWAVFVAMQIPDTVQRTSTVKAILLRYAGGINWESLQDGHSSFVVDMLHVPESWVHEATAYRLCYENVYSVTSDGLLPVAAGGVGAFKMAISGGGEADIEDASLASNLESSVNSFFRRKNMEVAYLGLAGLWGSGRANRIISSITGPYALFSSNAASEKLMELLVQIEQFIVWTGVEATPHLWNQGSGALLQFLRFKERYSGVRQILSEVSESTELRRDNNLDDSFFFSARDELCGLYRDACELLQTLKSRHSKTWQAHKNQDETIINANTPPNFSTVSHLYLCNELYHCVSMLFSVITSPQFRGAVDIHTLSDPLTLARDPSCSDNAANQFFILTRSYVASTASRLNATLSDRKGALPVDVVAFAF